MFVISLVILRVRVADNERTAGCLLNCLNPCIEHGAIGARDASDGSKNE
jgi:hypothetical protein